MEQETESLSAEEKAYFDSRGTTEIKADPPEETTTDETTVTGAESEIEVEAGADTGADDTEGEQQEPKRVPLAALTKERATTKELKGKLSEADRRALEAERKAAVLEDRWNQILQAQQQTEQQQPPEDTIPPEDDVVGRINWIASQLQKQDAKQAEAAKQREAEGQREQFRQALGKIEENFKASNPDYDAAVNFAAQSRDSELALLYPQSTPEQRQQAILGEWQNIVHAAITAGVNPAEQVYKFAEARGYKKAAPEQPAPSADDLEALERAVEGSTSLSGGSGSAPRTLGAQDIANMSPEEFEAWFAKPGNQQKFKRLAGAR